MKIKKICMFLISLLLIGNLTGCASNEEKVLNYLEDKYNEEFVIESFKNTGLLEDEYRGGKGIASLNTDNSYVFNVGISDSKEKEFYDNYDLVKLSQEFTNDFKNVVIDDFGAKSDCKVLIQSSGTTNTKNISAKEYIENEKDNICLLSNVIIEVNSEEDIKNSYQTILKTFEKLKSYDTRFYTLIVGFVGDVHKIEIEEFFRLIGVVDYSWDKIDGDLYGRLFINQHCEVNSINDLNKYFENYK